MKKAIAIIVSVLFVFAVASISFAADKAAPAKMEEKKAPMATEKKAHAKVKQVTGEVAAVDAKTNSITVKGKKGETTVTCEEKAKVMMGKEKKACADVKVGDKVTVKYTESDGKNMAKSVSIHAEKKAEPMKKEKKAKKAEPAKPETK